MIDGRRGASAAADAGRDGGSGAEAGGVGGTVCGDVIAPVISAPSRVWRSLIFANWLCADLFAASRLAFRLVISFETRAMDCCAALLSTLTGAALENPPIVAAPTTAPTAAAIATEAASMA